MKKLTFAALFGLITLAVSGERARASGWCHGGCGHSCAPGHYTFNFAGFSVNIGCKGAAYVGCGSCHGCPVLGPWYLYWPYEAHFSAPAPVPGGVAYPYWPGGMTAGHGGVHQTGYAPSYWYGH